MNEDVRKLSVNQVEYLAIEGGGGKGNALPGAMQALEYLGILKFDQFARAQSTLCFFQAAMIMRKSNTSWEPKTSTLSLTHRNWVKFPAS